MRAEIEAGVPSLWARQSRSPLKARLMASSSRWRLRAVSCSLGDRVGVASIARLMESRRVPASVAASVVAVRAFCSLLSLSSNSTMEIRSSCVYGVAAATSMGSEPGRSVTTPLTRLARDTVYRSEEHTSELQSLRHLVCRLLLAK